MKMYNRGEKIFPIVIYMQKKDDMGLIIITIIITVIGIYIYIKHFKIPKLNCIAMVTGAPKAGKSTLAIHFAIREHKKRVKIIKIRNAIRKIFKKSKLELPLLYSNIPLNCEYVPLTKELLLRKKNYVYGSVVYIGEFSLVANSMNYKDENMNELITLWAKLFGHQTRGGIAILDTQCIGDCHYAVKRSIGQYFYVHHTKKWFLLPFISVYVREMIYSDDTSTVNNIQKDIEEDLKRILVPKKIWKVFDAYCYSIFTDKLEVERETKKGNKKIEDIISFNNYKSIKEFTKNENRKKIR